MIFFYNFDSNIFKMKQTPILLLSLFVLTLSGCNESAAKKVDSAKANAVSANSQDASPASQMQANPNLPVMTFSEVSHDFGTINEGDKVETTFEFTNTGGSDLMIQDARGSCGCTVPEYPKNTPIAPGDSGKIVVNFDSNNKPGMQQKTVTLTTNTGKIREMLRIKAMVTADPVKQKLREDQARIRQQLNN